MKIEVEIPEGEYCGKCKFLVITSYYYFCSYSDICWLHADPKPSKDLDCPSLKEKK